MWPDGKKTSTVPSNRWRERTLYTVSRYTYTHRHTHTKNRRCGRLSSSIDLDDQALRSKGPLLNNSQRLSWKTLTRVDASYLFPITRLEAFPAFCNVLLNVCRIVLFSNHILWIDGRVEKSEVEITSINRLAEWSQLIKSVNTSCTIFSFNDHYFPLPVPLRCQK